MFLLEVRFLIFWNYIILFVVPLICDISILLIPVQAIETPEYLFLQVSKKVAE